MVPYLSSVVHFLTELHDIDGLIKKEYGFESHNAMCFLNDFCFQIHSNIWHGQAMSLPNSNVMLWF